MYPKLRASHALVALLALVPFAYLVRICVLLTIDVPLSDAWAMVPRLDHLYSGRLTFDDFWAQHNEHRPAVPIAVMLAVARLTRWDARWEIVVNLAVGVAIFAVYLMYLRSTWRARGGAPLWLVPVFSLLTFSAVQWENWIRGWQLTMLLCGFASLLCAYFVAQGTRRGAFGAAVACALCATYSFASGLALWPALAAGVWLTGGARRWIRLAIWSGVGALTYAAYFHDFHRWQPPMLSNFTSVSAMGAYVLYVLTQLGTGIAGFDPRLAAAAGAVGLAVFAALAFRLRSLRADPVYLFPLLIGVQSVATAASSALGRAWMGIDQAMSSRYTTLTLPLWCALLSLAALWRSTASRAPAWPYRARTALAAALVLVTLGSAVKSTRPAVAHAAGSSEILMYARRGLLTGKSNTLLLLLFPNVDEIHQRRAVLVRLRLSVFRPSAQPSYPLPGPE